MESRVKALIERAINDFLQKDSSFSSILSKYADRGICIDFRGIDYSLKFIITTLGIELVDEFMADTNVTTVRASVLDFIYYMNKKSNDKMSFDDSLEIEGKTDILFEVMHILRASEIDWEFLLAQKIGDVPAYLGLGLVKKIHSLSKHVTNVLAENTTDFLQDELEILPTNEDLESFIQDVSKLKNDVARVDARLQKLPSK